MLVFRAATFIAAPRSDVWRVLVTDWLAYDEWCTLWRFRAFPVAASWWWLQPRAVMWLEARKEGASVITRVFAAALSAVPVPVRVVECSEQEGRVAW
eukprot:EC786240.1.p1 GENE.EC786240.1~~EC786240.1.p1  ORF type:complete len:97 (+),score=13.21 EC786240.1:10-300(+)